MLQGGGVLFLGLLEASMRRRRRSRRVCPRNHCFRVRIIANICVSVRGFHTGQPGKSSLSMDYGGTHRADGSASCPAPCGRPNSVAQPVDTGPHQVTSTLIPSCMTRTSRLDARVTPLCRQGQLWGPVTLTDFTFNFRFQRHGG